MSSELLSFDTRAHVYSYLDLMTLLNVISKLSTFERQQIVKSKILNQKKSLLININRQIDFEELVYAIQLSSKLDLRIQKFE